MLEQKIESLVSVAPTLSSATAYALVESAATWRVHCTSQALARPTTCPLHDRLAAFLPAATVPCIMASVEAPCYTVVTEDNTETPSTSELRSALQKGSDEVKLDTLRKIIVATINGNPQVCLSHPYSGEDC